MMTKNLRIDCSEASYLAQCVECSWRSGPYALRSHAADVADRHARDLHGSKTARKALNKRAQRS